MPGPISDSYDPEFGTSVENIDISLKEIYDKLTFVLNGQSPIYILDLINKDLPKLTTATLSEKEWRLLRFSVERARDSL